MQITEVRIKLMDEFFGHDDNRRLHAFASITFDDKFVVRDLKIIEGTKGLLVAMPSRKLTDRCRCGTKNPLRSRYCTNCGCQLDENRALRGTDGRAKLHADIAHPINQGCREMIQDVVLEAYHAECERAKQPGYVCDYDADPMARPKRFSLSFGNGNGRHEAQTSFISSSARKFGEGIL